MNRGLEGCASAFEPQLVTPHPAILTAVWLQSVEECNELVEVSEVSFKASDVFFLLFPSGCLLYDIVLGGTKANRIQ